MKSQQETMVKALPPSSPHCLCVPLDFDYVLAQDESRFQECLHCPKGNGNVVSMFMSIADQNAAVFTWFKDSPAFLGHRSHFLDELIN